MKVKPLADRILVKRVESATMTKGGLYIPESAKEKPAEGVVMAVGSGKDDNGPSVSEGDRILFGKYAGTEIKIDGEDRLIIREEDILAVVTEE